jgi:phytoene synthase
MTTAVPIAMPAVDATLAEQIVRGSGTSFYWGMRLLPAAKRAAMFAVYAFCREVDDIADDPGPGAGKLLQLRDWREEIQRLFDGAPRRPLAQALKPWVSRFGLRQQDFLAVIDGMEMDAADRIRYQDMERLELYCDRVACAVGRLSVRIFGVPQPSGDALSDHLGRALQLTNILRDLKDDADRDRLYLPATLLRAHGIVDIDRADDVLRHPALASVCDELAGRAKRHFTAAGEIMNQCSRQAVKPARIMMEVYRRTLSRLVDRGWQRWAEPVSLSPSAKLWVALRYGMM